MSRDNTGVRNVFAVYDLSVSPVTYDILQFVEIAEMFRIYRQLDGVHFVFVTGAETEFRRSSRKDLALSDEDKWWRVRQILLPACWLIESCQGVSLFRNRAHFEQFYDSLPADSICPPFYSLETPRAMAMPSYVKKVHENTGLSPLVLRPSPAALQFADRWIENNEVDASKMVCLTLRQSQLESHRNARTSDWVKFAQTIREEGYQPVFLPDTDMVAEANQDDLITDFKVYWPGPVNLELRAGLYARAWICMSDNGAAAWIHQWMAGSRSITFQSPSKVPSSLGSEKERHRTQGLVRGEQYAFFSTTQWFAWREDTYEEILSEFRKMEAAIAAKQEA